MRGFLFRRGFVLPVVVVGVIPAAILIVLHGGLALSPAALSVGAVVFGIGFALLLSTTRLFSKNGGSLAPWNPPKRMVASGPYRYLRNPMILGIFVMLVGLAVGFESRAIAIWFAIFFAAKQIYIRFDEEPALRKRFGEDYAAYCAEVPRWIPRLSPAKERRSRSSQA